MSRVDMVAGEIKREISAILLEDLHDPRLGFTTITRVELTPDLRFARIFFSVYGNQEQWKDTEEGLTHASGFIRRLLGERLKLRFVPEILFKTDHSSEYSIIIEQQLNEIKLNEAKPETKKKKGRDGTKKPARRTKKQKK